MEKILELYSKREKLVVGVLSGTSVDAVDAVLVRLKGSGITTEAEVLDFKAYPYPAAIRNSVLDCSSSVKCNAGMICKLNFVIGRLFARSILDLISGYGLRPSEIDLIGSHGQTIYHSPSQGSLSGLSTKSTLQIGDPSVIANLTGITTIGDFRSADVAAGGDGAPLVPYLDYVMYRSQDYDRALINIGGISNVTVLPRGCGENDVSAFDCGPGNMMIDFLAKKFFGKKFDRNGKIAESGRVSDRLFDALKSKDRFYKMRPPKSTGREYYSEDFVEGLLRSYRNLAPEDVIATFTKFTAYAIYFNLRRFQLSQIIVSGGGARNKTLMRCLREYFPEQMFIDLPGSGVNADNKEAVLFALLANEIISGNKANLPSVTGSSGKVFLGKICIV